MGNTMSIDPAHVRIYHNIIKIQNPRTRVQMIQTCLSGIEFVQSAKRAGLYSYLLEYVSSVQAGHHPKPLPGEGQSEQPAVQIIQPIRSQYTQDLPRAMAPPPQIQMQITTYKDKKDGPSWTQITQSKQQKALTYFASCLEVLEIQEEVELTEETLKKAYKRISKRAHPDKGGNEEHFAAITRAYEYLFDILRRMQGGRERAPGVVEAPQVLDGTRKEDAKAWQHVEPVRLNPKNLDMNAFNKMFESTHIPDPDADGYGDWLKDPSGSANTSRFNGKYNRDVFNSVFADEARKQGQDTVSNRNTALTLHPDQMALLPTMGVEIGRDRPETYTAAPNSKQQFTDLRAAYTTDSTFSGKVANVVVEERKLDTYRAQRESAPVPLTGQDMSMLQSSEMEMKRREEMRQRRKAEQDSMENRYFERMKQLVITNN
jgi:hypothetical protein